MRRFWGALLLLAFGFAPARAANASVSIVEFAYDPASVTIVAGDQVTWTNNGVVIHTVTADDGSFDSGDLSPGATFARTFNSPGTITYHCTQHSQMTGTITVQAQISASPSSVDFGLVVVGTTSPPQTVTATNNTDHDINVSSSSISGPNAPDFAISSDLCARTLGPGLSCTIDVTFSPSDLGTRTATLEIPFDGLGSPTTVSLQGQGALANGPALALSGDLAFDFARVGATGSQKTETITSIGSDPVVISSVTTTVDDYVIAADACSGKTLPTGAKCDVVVQFAPTREGTRSGSLVVTSNAGTSPDSAALTGIGDGTPPVTIFETADLAVLGLDANKVNGSVEDALSGVASVMVTFQPLVGPPAYVKADLECDTPNLCGWIAPPPYAGFFTVTVAGTDKVGNVETSGPTIHVIYL